MLQHIKIFISLLIFSAMPLSADDTIHHKMSIDLRPVSHEISATDTITIPASLAKEGIILQVNGDLSVTQISGSVKMTQIAVEKNAADIGIDRDDAGSESLIKVNHYALNGFTEGEDAIISLSLKGSINNPVKQLNEEYARGFSQSPGLIEERGVYLAGSTYWVPTVTDTMITYDIDVTMPVDWRSVSQGARTAYETNERHSDSWSATTPTEEIYLIAAKFAEYELPVGNVKAMAFLRTPDDALANKYLEVTAQYMEMYRGLLGPYPYTKFALVENFWETGYGMPSFTLLGSQVIRFPFILHSSYPHELLHNWWGNGVYIDHNTGNWAEGLTAYMADHLVAEQNGKGGEYRRSTLQRYTNYVDDTTDFSLRKFRGRFNAVTEAVGYGKTSMVWNMLRVKVGDDDFKRSFQHFYRNFKYKVGRWDDIRVAFEEITGKDLKPFFTQWVDGTGAPELAISNSTQNGDGLNITITQNQKHAPFTLQIPVVVYTADGVERHLLEMDGREKTFNIMVKGDVVRVDIDPEFDMFRRLHWAEIPPSLGNAFGADKVTIVVPSHGDVASMKRYENLAAIWSKDSKMNIVRDDEIEALPTEGGIWVLGTENRFHNIVSEALTDYNVASDSSAVTFKGRPITFADNSTVIAVRNPANPESVIVGLTVHSDASLEGLLRKLPHYGKYSYLAFTGDAPDNVEKGEWAAVGSPLTAIMNKDVQSSAKLEPRAALAELKPAFDSNRMMGHVEHLASPELEGRGVGTQGLDKAADYIAKEFMASGLMPGGDNPGTFFQSFEMNGPDGTPVKVKNVVGIIPGKNPKYDGQSVILTAHYDHLGKGWPNVRAEFADQTHFGADDNASGVAVLLELAKTMAKSSPERAIIFVATTAEESGLIGARHYVKTMKSYPISKATSNINLDTVGRATDKLLVFGGNSATEWRFIFMGTEATTGITAELVMQDVNASDHTAFAEAGVPAIHIFGSATVDYHRPSDTSEKIKPESLMKVAAISKEILEYLAGRPEPLTSTLKPVNPMAEKVLPPADPKSGRKVSTGTMPDFTYAGKGVKVSSVAADSAGDKAGLKAGDIITNFGGVDVTNLREYTSQLGKYNPGDTVDVVVNRGAIDVKLKLILAER